MHKESLRGANFEVTVAFLEFAPGIPGIPGKTTGNLALSSARRGSGNARFAYVFWQDSHQESCEKGPAAQKCSFNLPRPQGGTKSELALARARSSRSLALARWVPLKKGRKPFMPMDS